MDPASALAEARSLMFNGRHAEALARVDEVLADHPELLDAQLMRGALLLEMREGELAIAAFEQAAAAAPRSSEAWNGLARALHALGDEERALENAYRARDLLREGDNYRQRAAVYLTILWCFREMRMYREALEAAEEGLEGMPDAILAQWAAVVEEEYAESQKEEC